MQAIRLYSTGVDVNAAVAARPSDNYVITSSQENLGYKALEVSTIDHKQQLWLRNKITDKLVDAVNHAEWAIRTIVLDRGMNQIVKVTLPYTGNKLGPFSV